MSIAPLTDMDSGPLMEGLVEKLRSMTENKDLSIKTTEIPDGAMKGRVMIEVQTKAGFRLLELPPELRERIYGYVFAEPTAIQIGISSTMFRDEGFHPPKTYGTVKLTCGPNFRNDKTHKGQSWNGRTAKWTGGPPNPLSLLLVNKEIHAEATPVAYRTNRFVFQNNVFNRVDRFVETIGSSVQHLGEVEFRKIGSIKQLKHIMYALRDAGALRRLYISRRFIFLNVVHDARDAKDPDSWACAFHRLIRLFLVDLKKKYNASNRLWKVSDVVQFIDDPLGWESDTFKVGFPAFEVAFREIARAYLDEE
ncbi:hypothetical protein BST61_g1219 [Cercospora zeina]